MENKLKEIVRAQKQGEKIGIYSACSANEFVIKAVLLRGLQDNSAVLIESTANQCDQFGGYTGMKPLDFKKMVYKHAQDIGFDTNKLFLGGDHLGPLTFVKNDEKQAMDLAVELVRSYVLAGFTKIHLDTSMKVNSDDENIRLSDEIIANRAALLAYHCQEAYLQLLKENPNAVAPVYIVGSEVPIPGGATSTTVGLQVSSVNDFKKSVAAFEKAFKEKGLDEAWNNVIGFVVQPGVEENDLGCIAYDRSKAKELSASIKEFDNLVFEAHSTDYQSKQHLRELVEDGYAILKVGPALTFALREGLFALADIEEEMNVTDKSDFVNILDQKMLENPKYWINHYHGSQQEIAYKRKYSHSDRCRYYLNEEEVDKAIKKLLKNVGNNIDLDLLKKHLPIQYEKIVNGKLENDSEAILLDKVINTIDDYLYGSNQKELF